MDQEFFDALVEKRLRSLFKVSLYKGGFAHCKTDARACLVRLAELSKLGKLPYSVAFFLLACKAEEIVDLEAPQKMGSAWSKLRDAELELSFTDAADEPIDLVDEYLSHRDNLIAEELSAAGMGVMSELLKNSPEMFNATSTEGEAELGLSEEDLSDTSDNWLPQLSDHIWNCVSGVEGFGGFDIASRDLMTLTQVIAAPAVTALNGGALDGEIAWPVFQLDVSQLVSYFDKVIAIQWNSGLTKDEMRHGGVVILGEKSSRTIQLTVEACPSIEGYDPDHFQVIGIE